MPEDKPPVRRKLSITCRLVCGYTLVSLVMLTVAAVLLHRGLRRGFEIEDGELFSDRVADIRRLLTKSPPDMAEVREEIERLAGEREAEKFYGRLIDAYGKIVVETPGAAEILPAPHAFPVSVSADDKADKVTYATTPAGGPVWIAAAEAGGAFTYQLGLDTRHVENWLAEFSHTLMAVVAGATALSALLGWAIARHSLRPLAQITAAAQRVTATGLHEPIGRKAWPGELVSLAAEFDRMLARLQHSFERLSQFTGDAAHEFRTPLNNLLGATSLALARPRTEEEYRALLETNLEEFQRLNHMMERLLFLARADNAQTVLRRERLDAVAAMREIIEFFSALAEEHGIVLEFQGGGVLSADPDLLRLALTNLVSNALRHAPSGSTVTLTAAECGGDTTISVQDEGAGIAPEHLPHLFERFYRADAARGGAGGSGLGLSLVQSIMQLHGGEATAANASGGGAVFQLRFPHSSPPGVTSSSAPSPEDTVSPPRRQPDSPP
jgi:two-component system heavy metal sensor histidine kinase CusS